MKEAPLFALPMEEEARRERRMEIPSTPGRPPLLRKSVPSKWDDAEKWLISTSSSCHGSPANNNNNAFTKSRDAFQQHKVGRFHGGVPTQVVLKDKFTEHINPPATEGFLFRASHNQQVDNASIEVVSLVHQNNIGTFSTNCSSPARHNTPYMSGPLVPNSATLDISELKDCHFAKLELSAQYDNMMTNWSTREEEEEEVSKSLRHFEIGCGKKSVAESRACLWEEEERTKSCARYKREEAKIQAWVNLERAKAEERSRKLEVKIQKKRASLEEKLMKRMAMVHKRAEELRAAAQMQHSQENLRASANAQKLMRSRGISQCSCGCFTCSKHI